MMNDPISRNTFAAAFADKMSGGAFVCRAGNGREIIYANKRLAEIFECHDIAEFLDYVGGSVNGFFKVTQENVIRKDAEFQSHDAENSSGYTFFDIRTIKGRILRVVNHWRYENDPDEGGLIYGLIFTHSLDNNFSDFDTLTGLYGRKRFQRYIEAEIPKMKESGEKYAIVYLNIVNFKLLNIENGVAEGDKCLKIVADILVKQFDKSYLAKLSDDHFAVFGEYDDIAGRTETAENEFRNIYGKYYNVFLKFGIFKFDHSPDFDVETALSRAKIACDYIKRDIESNIVEYSDDIEEMIRTREYIVRKLDEAIEDEWIKVYFQPVIRSLTGSLCGMESLVRWIDPEIGFLPPDRFISILENERCIHKLDSYVVERVCRYMRERLNAGLPVVPVSVNFSQMDFVMCNMLEVVERAIEKYDIPRDYIHIEITESMIAADESMMHKIITQFKKAGYEVWMDDFGSGYSSLTVLKDYRFDTLKMDMRFLTPFNDKSKSIMRSVVTMAKNIGMKTLAEGVETKEQLDFLREIGCGMIQGYYYGKPEPIEDVFEHISEKNITIETRKWRHFYETAGFNVMYTDSPLEIIEDDGENFTTLFMNSSYRKQLFDTEFALEDIDRKIYHTASPLIEKYREFANQIEASGNVETFYYPCNGMYLRFTGQAIAECDGHYIIKGSITNISLDQSLSDSKRLDSKARQLNLLFETVLLVKLKEHTVTPLLGGFKYIKSGASVEMDLQKVISIIENEIVHPAERAKCSEFMSADNLNERVEKAGTGYVTEIFRLKQPDGSYKQKEFFIMMIPGTSGEEYLCCMKNYVPQKEDKNSASSSVTDSELSGTTNNAIGKNVVNIWKNIMWNSSLKFFWKDADFRFMGVSKAFLDYFGFDSDKAIIGKTDDEMNWHIDNEAFNKNENDVICKGEKLVNMHGHCIVNGMIRDIIYDKIPIYENDKIVGLIGCFRDSEDELFAIGNKTDDSRKDPVTGLLNAHGFVDYLIDYAVKYIEDGLDYGIIVLNNLKHDRIIETYGKDFANKVLKTIAKGITEVTGKTCVVSRPKNSIFAILTHVTEAERFREIAQVIEESLKNITEVDGNSITTKIKIASKIRSEEVIQDERFYERTMKYVLK